MARNDRILTWTQLHLDSFFVLQPFSLCVYYCFCQEFSISVSSSTSVKCTSSRGYLSFSSAVAIHSNELVSKKLVYTLCFSCTPVASGIQTSACRAVPCRERGHCRDTSRRNGDCGGNNAAWHQRNLDADFVRRSLAERIWNLLLGVPLFRLYSARTTVCVSRAA
jgi:hypothetical protein